MTSPVWNTFWKSLTYRSVWDFLEASRWSGDGLPSLRKFGKMSENNSKSLSLLPYLKDVIPSFQTSSFYSSFNGIPIHCRTTKFHKFCTFKKLSNMLPARISPPQHCSGSTFHGWHISKVFQYQISCSSSRSPHSAPPTPACKQFLHFNAKWNEKPCQVLFCVTLLCVADAEVAPHHHHHSCADSVAAVFAPWLLVVAWVSWGWVDSSWHFFHLFSMALLCLFFLFLLFCCVVMLSRRFLCSLLLPGLCVPVRVPVCWVFAFRFAKGKLSFVVSALVC